MKAIGIIPARYGSTRFPGKPLALIAGKPMIAWVYENVNRASSLDKVIVATDDERIKNAIESIGGQSIMTSAEHSTGTERVFEAASNVIAHYGQEDLVVVNIQGDEPLIDPNLINDLVEVFANPTIQIATAVRRVKRSAREHNPNEVKVVRDLNGKALYFSRATIPFVRDLHEGELIDFWIHVGIYAYRFDVLRKLVELKSTVLEKLEQLEQLRWLEYGFHVQTIETSYQTIAVDVPEDIARVEHIIKTSFSNVDNLS